MNEKNFSFYDIFVPFTNKKIILFLLCIGFTVFGNSFFNPFIFDDLPQIVQNTAVHTIYSIPSFFITSISLPHQNFPLLHLYYKPLLFTSYSILWNIFSGDAFGFHFIQTLLHITNSILVFLLFAKFFKKPLSFLLSVLFLIHPIQSETVIYAANLQDVLFVFFGLLATHIILQKRYKLKTISTFFLTIIFLLSSLFSKETGILFSGIVIFASFLFSKTKRKQTIVAVTLTSILYFVLRFLAYFSSTSILTLSGMQQISFSERLISIPKIIWYYLATFFFPLNLATGQAWIVKQTNISDFWLPLLLDSSFFICLFLIGFFIYKTQRKLFSLFLFFTIWFLLGLLFHIQLIPLDLTVADRWFYFPSIGLLGIFGICLSILFLKFSNVSKKLLAFCLIFIIFILSIITIVRNSQWQSPFTLYSHDIIYAGDNAVLLSYYGGLLIDQGDYKDAKMYLKKSLKLDQALGSNSINLGAWYEHANNFIAAQIIYQRLLKQKNVSSAYKQLAYENLSRLTLFKQKNFNQAKKIAQEGLHLYPHDMLLSEYLAITDYELGDKHPALVILSNLLKTNQNRQTQFLYDSLQNTTFVLPN